MCHVKIILHPSKDKDEGKNKAVAKTRAPCKGKNEGCDLSEARTPDLSRNQHSSVRRT